MYVFASRALGFAAKQSPTWQEIASDKEQERPRKDINGSALWLKCAGELLDHPGFIEKKCACPEQKKEHQELVLEFSQIQE